jgi:ethanolamine ammonia-lyase small subunit
MKPPKVLDDLRLLKTLTAARIGLPRAGSSVATHEMLNFDLDHARARDAVHLPFQSDEILNQLNAMQFEALPVHSAAKDRTTYLQRPDLGRQLDDASRTRLSELRSRHDNTADLAIIIADGLSTSAIHSNALIFLNEFLPVAKARGWSHAPIVVASQARVALADEIGELLNARLSIILIGERPGLSSSDSMGIYLTYGPCRGKTDADRNCISNIHQGGISHPEAARLLQNLISSAFRLQLSGVQLKDDSTLLEA